MKRAVIFDLDGTLVVERPSATAAFEAAAALAAERLGLDGAALAASAPECARELWYSSPTHAYAQRTAISSWEGLWCRFEGDSAELRALREWAPIYRRGTWRAALARQGAGDDELAAELAEAFIAARRSTHTVYDDVAATLGSLHGSRPLALLTNGASCLQREKLAGSGLGGFFERVLVGSDILSRKPEPAVFEELLLRLGRAPEEVVMIGDSLESDVAGALAAGITPIWLRREGAVDDAEARAPAGAIVLPDLLGLADALAALE